VARCESSERRRLGAERLQLAREVVRLLARARDRDAPARERAGGEARGIRRRGACA